MVYRDDLEAAKQRIESLEESLAAEKAKNEKPSPKTVSRPVVAAASVDVSRVSDGPWDGPFFGTPFSLGTGGTAHNKSLAYAAGVFAIFVSASALLFVGDITNPATAFVATALAFAIIPSFYGASRFVAPGLPIRARDESRQLYWFTIAKKPALIRLAIGMGMPWTVAIVAKFIGP